MNWIKCSERMPECNVSTSTWLGGDRCSEWVIAKFPDGDLAIMPAIVVSYDGVLVWYNSCDDTKDGGLDRCTSHGGSEPTHWIPMPEPMVDTYDRSQKVEG